MAKFLTGMIAYSQKDSRWTGLTPDFADNGCAVCSAASIAFYKEKATVTPKTLQERGVFNTSSAYVQNWDAVSTKFSFHSREYDKNITGGLAEIKKQIDANNPVLMVVEGSYTHYIVAYGYYNSCTAASDVRTLDPMGLYNTLGAALNWIYPNFRGINRIINK